MSQYIKILIIYCCCFHAVFGQDYAFRFENSVYDDDIRTVTVEINNLPSNFPVIELQSGQKLRLEFDDLLVEERMYYYRIIHCDRNWEPSSLTELDYLNGFNDERLRNYEYSVNTRIPYIHYWQEFPNKDTQFKISGNYLLLIYEDNEETPILTRRFVVTERNASLQVTGTFAGDVSKIRFNQDFQLDVQLGKLNLRNPLQEVQLVMIQNENWNSVIKANPNFIAQQTVRFNKLNTFSFPGLSEYREFDTRSLQLLRRGVQFIDRKKDGTDVLLMLDESRRNKVYLLNFDFNGKFFIQNMDAITARRATDVLSDVASAIVRDESLRQSLRDSMIYALSAGVSGGAGYEERNINSDYTNVIFTLKDDIALREDENIYILGAMNDWEPREAYRMERKSEGMYAASVLLKQGYYNYYYAVVGSGGIDIQKMEGSWNDTENDYQALVYFRGFGDIYDRVVGFASFNTENLRLQFR